ncbi:phosphotransferase family protein [Arthrobacter sp. Z1-15]
MNGVLHDIVDLAVDGLPPGAQAAQRTVVDLGTAHTVVLLRGYAAVRVRRDLGTAAGMRRRQQLVDSIPASVGFLLPRSLGPVVELDGTSAVANELIPGAPCPAGEGDPGELRKLLARVASIPTGPIEELLAEPLEFCGGAQWYGIQRKEVIPLLDGDVQGRALHAVCALAALEPVREVFAHGDLAGQNVFWDGGRVVGVLDWDLASRSDRSTDLACVGAWNGWDKLPLIADSEDTSRALVRRNTFRLQQLAFAVVNGRSAEEIQRTAARASAWLRQNL